MLLEHWSLIVNDVRKANLRHMVTGDFQSVGLEDAIARLAAIVNEEVDLKAVECFRALQKHRNKMVHFFHRADESSEEGQKLKAQIVKEQCQGWYHLKQLIDVKWKAHFETVAEAVKSIDAKMRRHRDFLKAVYDSVSDELQAASRAGATLEKCHSCRFEAHVIAETGPHDSRCKVCGNVETFILHRCDGCQSKFVIHEGSEAVCCPSCNKDFELHDIMYSYCDEADLPEKDFYTEGGYAHCSDCNGYESVGTVDGTPFCFQCFTWHNQIGVCEWCHARSTGDLEESYLSGCAMCDGRLGHMRDD